PGADVRGGLVLPAALARIGIDAVQEPVLVAGVDEPLVDADGRLEGGARLVLPFYRALVQVESVQVFVARADVNRLADDGSSALDGAAGRELPADDQLVGQADGGDARLQGIAAEEHPVGGGVHHKDTKGTKKTQKKRTAAHGRLRFLSLGGL